MKRIRVTFDVYLSDDEVEATFAKLSEHFEQIGAIHQALDQIAVLNIATRDVVVAVVPNEISPVPAPDRNAN